MDAKNIVRPRRLGRKTGENNTFHRRYWQVEQPRCGPWSERFVQFFHNLASPNGLPGIPGLPATKCASARVVWLSAKVVGFYSKANGGYK